MQTSRQSAFLQMRSFRCLLRQRLHDVALLVQGDVSDGGIQTLLQIVGVQVLAADVGQKRLLVRQFQSRVVITQGRHLDKDMEEAAFVFFR